MGGLIPECIIDANVIFDAVEGNILPEIFQLGYHIITTDFVVMLDIKSIQHSELIALGLIVQDMPGELVEEILKLREKHIELSIPDLSVFVMARHNDAIMLSGDGELRRVAKKAGVAFHGTLWLIDEMVEKEILQPERAAEALQAMCDNDRWLPVEECRRRIRMWGIENTKK
ncbi:PIN domain-containing protein [Methanogenium organophilum]|uniref:PIN domain-containing protein n=1 Tax=Methanogenium organophilum TaxID=2199 RepID=A0A9X9T948_METOG|nr:hypothetical protein [Methanogenium organophilum]WAI02305.1 hypothetical protein OU421_05385 [Methanogenium organophilum]